MADETVTVAMGEMRLQLQGTNAKPYFKFAIRADGIDVRQRDLEGGPWSPAQSLFALLGQARPLLQSGYLNLTGLASAPFDAFRNLAIDYGSEAYKLTITQDGPFASRANFQLRGLNLTFTARKGLERIQVSGSLTATLFGQEAQLTPVFTETGALVFRPAQPLAPKASGALGALNLPALEIGGQDSRGEHLQALFAFIDGVGKTPHDTSAATDAGQDEARRKGEPLPLPDANLEQRLMAGIRASRELTVEAWVNPKSGPAQTLPSIILSKDPQNRYFALAQGDAAGNAAMQFQARLQTAEGSGEKGLATPANLSSDTNYLALTRTATGDAGLYLNGVRIAPGVDVPGALDWFGDSAQLSLTGEIQRVAIHDHALTPDQVRRAMHPPAILRDQGTLSSTGRFTFPAPPDAFRAPLFAGTIEIRGETPSLAFMLNGRLRFFPEGSPLQIGADLSIPVDAGGAATLSGHPVSVSLPDFQLVDPRLTIAAGAVTLTGRWLGQEVTFTGKDQGNEMILQASNLTFNVPDTALGPFVDAVTGDRLADNVAVSAVQAKLDLTLGSSGFLAQVTTSFKWALPSAAVQDASAQTITIFSPPPTKNALFDLVLDELQRQANDLLADRLTHPEDYYVQAASAAPLRIHHGPSAAAPTSITIQLPDLYTTAPTLPLSTSAFTLTRTTSPVGYQLTIAVAATPDRNDYEAFLSKLETRDIKPGAIELVRARIAERLPVPFNDVLYYHYGLTIAGENRVDLQPGMRLRVDCQHYQLVHPSDLQALDGYVGGGSVFYHLSSYPSGANLKLGFDGFVSGLQVTTNPDLTVVGAASTIDLLHPAFRRRFFRLVYPSQLTGPGQTGWTGTERVAKIIGADTLAALNAGPTGVGVEADARVEFFFRGRATVIPEITIFVQGQPLYVPIGTTVRQVIERYMGIPAAGLTPQNLNAHRGRLRPRRLVHEGVNSAPVYKFINFADAPQIGAADFYDLPVVKGDRYSF